MKADKIKAVEHKFTHRFPTTLPTMGWYFSDRVPDNALEFDPGAWTCMFELLQEVANGKRLCISKACPGCAGAACYMGFREPGPGGGKVLSAKEGFKQTPALGNAFYEQVNAKKARATYLVLETLRTMDDNVAVEVVNCWVDPLTLTGLVTLANFDRHGNDNVTIPFASGCQSMWTLPYTEGFTPLPKAVAGAMDPAMRAHVPNDTLLFSVPSKRFLEMAANIDHSFASQEKWQELVKPGGPQVLLETGRLSLRTPLLSDHAFFTRLYGNPRVMQHIPPTKGPLSAREAEKRLHGLIRHWKEHGYGMFVVEMKASALPIGYCGLRWLEEAGEIELGYIIDEPYWGMGIASEAARACVGYAADSLTADTLVSLTHPANTASQHLLSKLGFRRDSAGDGSFHGMEHLFFINNGLHKG